MTNLQDINSYSKNEFFFGMTNFREGLDDASIRNGRIDDLIEFHLPDADILENAYERKISTINKTT